MFRFRREQRNLQIWAQYGDFRFWPIWGQQKIRFFQNSSCKTQIVRFILVTLKAALAAKLSSIRRLTFWPIWGQQKYDFSQPVPYTSNGAFSLSYSESSLTCKFELNTAILDFDRFQLRKNQIFHNSSRKPQMVRFVLVTLRDA